MNLIKCPNNHIYNADHYPFCPECVAIKSLNPADTNYSQTSSLNQHSIATVSVERSIEDINNPDNSMLAGWLVCIDGSEYGHSFPILTGKNAIGRGANMDIHLSNDPQISRYIHAVITYDNKANAFYLETKNSNNPIVLNDTIISTASAEPAVLHNRDRIRIGAMTFIFIALCDDYFKWED